MIDVIVNGIWFGDCFLFGRLGSKRRTRNLPKAKGSSEGARRTRNLLTSKGPSEGEFKRRISKFLCNLVRR